MIYRFQWLDKTEIAWLKNLFWWCRLLMSRLNQGFHLNTPFFFILELNVCTKKPKIVQLLYICFSYVYLYMTYQLDWSNISVLIVFETTSFWTFNLIRNHRFFRYWTLLYIDCWIEGRWLRGLIYPETMKLDLWISFSGLSGPFWLNQFDGTM